MKACCLCRSNCRKVRTKHSTVCRQGNRTQTCSVNSFCESFLRGKCKFNAVASSRSQWPRGLRRRSAAERLLGSWVRISPGAWMFFSCTVFMLSDRGLYDRPIPRPEESYRLWCVLECDQVKNQNPLHLL
jgi:hypothetical protein